MQIGSVRLSLRYSSEKRNTNTPPFTLNASIPDNLAKNGPFIIKITFKCNTCEAV